jgi:hypothetical protein
MFNLIFRPSAPVTDNLTNDPTSKGSDSLGTARNKGKKNSSEGPGALQKAPQRQTDEDGEEEDENALEPASASRRSGGRRMVPVHQSRIADRPVKEGEKDSSLKIKIELDLEVEVEIYARIKGDITIGLM